MTDAPLEKKASWSVIAMLAAAQFIMVLDTTVMNVSISQIVEDLHTTVVGLQTAITVYTLVMAAFMLIGGKLGDRWGAKRAYILGMLIYGLGSLITALSPNIQVLLVGWSFIEGFGAVLVIPAIAALTAITYSGRQRAIAYGIIGGVCGASAAIGPLIGGWVTANYTWRLVFAAETVTVLTLMLFLKAIPATKGRQLKLDGLGAFLSAAGLGIAVFGILLSSQWGWVTPKSGAPFTILGLSPVFWFIILGLILLGAFSRHEESMVQAGKEPLLDMGLLQIPRLRAGLVTLLSQQLIIMSTFFVLPLYLQSVLGYDALETGKRILPLSISLFLFALGGSTMTGRYSPKRIVETGLTAMVIGEILMIGLISPDLKSLGFSIALALVGGGLGLMASQLSNVNMSSVPPERGSEVGGLQGTFQNLGASLGTALIGSILLASLVTNFTTTILMDPALAPMAQDLAAVAEANANFVTVEQVSSSAEAAGLPPEQVAAITIAYSDAQITALKASFAGIAFFSLLALAYVRRLPTKKEQTKADASSESRPLPETG
jgi:EmrB/QacA subfamily drug resistance transporter